MQAVEGMVDAASQDCYFFYYSTCKKGAACPYRHCAAALGTEEVCQSWLASACLKPSLCPLRHMRTEKSTRSLTPCFWESTPAGCLKPHCVFQHSLPRPSFPATAGPVHSANRGGRIVSKDTIAPQTSATALILPSVDMSSEAGIERRVVVGSELGVRRSAKERLGGGRGGVAARLGLRQEGQRGRGGTSRRNLPSADLRRKLAGGHNSTSQTNSSPTPSASQIRKRGQSGHSSTASDEDSAPKRPQLSREAVDVVEEEDVLLRDCKGTTRPVKLRRPRNQTDPLTEPQPVRRTQSEEYEQKLVELVGEDAARVYKEQGIKLPL